MIKLEIAGTELTFEPTSDVYAAFMSGVAAGELADASHNFVMQSVSEESKPFVRDLAEKNGGAMVQIAGVISQEYAPRLEIKVKK